MRIHKIVLISMLLLAAVFYVSAQDARWSKSSDGFAFGPESRTSLFDEFTSANVSQGLNWSLNGGGGNVAVQPFPLVPGHLGLMEVNSPSSGTGWAYYMLANQNTYFLDPSLWKVDIFADVEDANASLGGVIRFGAFDTLSMNSRTPNTAVFFEADSSGSTPTWTCVNDVAGTRTTASSGVTAPLNVFHELGIRFDGAGNANWFIDGEQVCTSLTTAVPSFNADVAFESADNATHGAKVWIDYFRMNEALSR